MQKTGRNLDDPNLPGAVDVMDLLTVKEQGTEILIEDLLDRVGELGAQRLVVDSFTALATAFQKTIDARITLHILGKLTKRSGCTTLLIIEIPSGSSNIGGGGRGVPRRLHNTAQEGWRRRRHDSQPRGG